MSDTQADTTKVTNTTIQKLPKEGGLKTDSPATFLETFLYQSAWFRNSWTEKNANRAIELFPYKILQVKGTDIEASFTLPISPSQLSISTPFAIVTTPTLNGLVEEHNSIRFKEIEISGTMGVFPADRDPTGATGWNVGQMFDPTGIADNAVALAASIPLVQILALRGNALVDSEKANANSGYANLHRLRIFLESYAEKKKTDKDLRLVFASYKDKQFYLTTPTAFNVRRSAASPLEYEYSLGLRAWGSYNPADRGAVAVSPVLQNNPLAMLSLVVSSFAAVPFVALGAVSTVLSVPQAIGTAVNQNFLGVSGWKSSIQRIQEALNDNELPTQDEVAKASDDMAKASKAFSDKIGLVSPPQFTYGSEIFPLPTPSQQGAPTTEQLNGLFALNNVKISLDHLKASLMAQAPVQASPLDYVAGLASKSGIAFQTAVSKYPVPFPSNSTLEHIAAKYLGDPNRWLEIATLNGLMTPYVDNTGFSAPLLYDGYQNKVIILGDKLDIGKSVTLSSSTQPRKTYGVVSFIKNGNYYEVTLDNDFNKPLKNTNTLDDLSRYKKADNATLHYYMPNTVRAGQIIYIPSNEPSNINGFNSSQIPSLKQYEEEIRISGVDFLLSSYKMPTNLTRNVKPNDRVTAFPTALDLVIQDNDVALSYGLTNLQQSLYLILFTPVGSILQHPEFGIGVPVGSSNVDINYQDFEQSIRKAILADRSFSDVEFITSSLNKGVLTVTTGVRVSQINKVLPAAFDVNLRGA
jgi:nucleoid-associated protein YgaU